MFRRFQNAAAIFVFLALGLLLGCGGNPTAANKKTEGKTAAAGHDHDHDHGGGGPHGGHIIELGEEEYHAEWLHDDKTDKVTIYLLDSTMKKESPSEAEHLTIDIELAGQTTSYKIPAVNRTGEKPMTARFEVVDKALLVGLTIGESAKATLHATIGGKKFSAKIEHHDHDEHGHDHAHDKDAKPEGDKKK